MVSRQWSWVGGHIALTPPDLPTSPAPPPQGRAHPTPFKIPKPGNTSSVLDRETEAQGAKGLTWRGRQGWVAACTEEVWIPALPLTATGPCTGQSLSFPSSQSHPG